MTDKQRDEILISLVNGQNLLMQTLNDFRAELKEDIRQSEARTDVKLDNLKTELLNEIKASEDRTDVKLDNLKTELLNEIKASEDRTDVKLDNLKSELINDMVNAFKEYSYSDIEI